MMNQEDLFKKLGSILNELNDQYEYLAQNPQKFNELELELFLANANFLTDHVEIIRKINAGRALKELPQPVEAREDGPVVPPVPEAVPVPQTPEQAASPLPDHQDIPRLEQEPRAFEFILQERSDIEEEEYTEDQIAESPSDSEPGIQFENAPETWHKLVQEEEPEAVAIEDTEVEAEDTLPSDELGPEPFLIEKAPEPIPAPVANLVEDQVEEKLVRPTLNDLLAGGLNKDHSAAVPSSGPPISDLKQAINLNDKLLYIKDLFNGYNLAYSEAIELINKMPDFKTADTFLKNNYASKNNWAAKQATVDKFYDLLNRRFK